MADNVKQSPKAIPRFIQIETRLWERDSKGVDDIVHQLDALARYAKRSASALRGE